MTMPELSRMVRLDALGTHPRDVTVEADETERDALAARFGLLSLDALTADVTLRLGDAAAVIAEGHVRGVAEQACVVTGQAVPAEVDEPVALRFVPATGVGDEDVELDEGDLDTIPYEGGAVDLGEAVAQSFALALDPFPRAPGAAEHLSAAGVLSEEQAEAARRDAGPFAALNVLRKE